MREFDTNAEPNLTQLMIGAAAVESATGEHLARIQEAGGYEFELYPRGMLNLAQGQIPDDPTAIFKASLNVELWDRGLDLRSNVPAQVANRLRLWGERLIELSRKVAAVESRDLVYECRAHIIEDLQTGERIESGPFYDLAQDEMIDAHNETGHAYRIITAPMAEFPQQEVTFSTLVSQAVQRAEARAAGTEPVEP